MASSVPRPDVFRQHLVYLIRFVNVEALLPYLVSCKLITWEDYEKVKLKLKGEGQAAAAELLFAEILRRNPDPDLISKLMDALISSSQYEVAKKLQENTQLETETVQESAMTSELQLSVKVPQLGKEDIEINYEKKIGSGQFGVVYKGVWKQTEVAVKEVHLNARQRKKSEENIKEIKICATARHPNIVQLMAYCFTSSSIQILYELIEGDNLDNIIFDQHIKEQYSLSHRDRMNISIQMISALSYLHGLNPKIIHGDIKPANVMVTSKGKDVKLCDMGVSKLKDQGESTTTGHFEVGTVLYMAPEVLLGKKASGTRSDIYSLAGTIVELFVEEDLWPDNENNRKNIMGNIESGEKPPTLQKIKNQTLQLLLSECLNHCSAERPSLEEASAIFSSFINEDSQSTCQSSVSDIINNFQTRVHHRQMKDIPKEQQEYDNEYMVDAAHTAKEEHELTIKGGDVITEVPLKGKLNDKGGHFPKSADCCETKEIISSINDSTTANLKLHPIGPKLNILLLGMNGVGKSKLGNNILEDKTAFGVSGTYMTVAKEKVVRGRKLHVVDTPSPMDIEYQQKVIDEIAYHPEGFDAILLLVRYSARFTLEEIKSAELFKLLFSEAQNHTVLVVTYGDTYRRDCEHIDRQPNFQDELERVSLITDPTTLGPLYRWCRKKWILIDNFAEGDMKIRQMNELVGIVDEITHITKGRFHDSLFKETLKEKLRLLETSKKTISNCCVL